jgi:hypothetical protein
MFGALRADVAQLVEQRFRKPQVTGSNPVVGSSLRSQRSGGRRLSRRNLSEGGLFVDVPYRGSELRLGKPAHKTSLGAQREAMAATPE